MATKKKPGTDIAVRPQGAVTKVDASLPDFLKAYKGKLGTESIEASDVTVPRIKIGQGTSDEVKSGLLKEGDQFLNLTKQVLAANGKPLPIVVIARSKEYILWRPRKDNGGGILARAKRVETKDGVRYQWDKPNTDFKVKVEGLVDVTWHTANYIDEDGLDKWASEIPGNAASGIAATAHHNYVVALPTFEDMIAAISLSRSTSRKAKDFNALLKLGKGAPMFGRVFNATTADAQNDKGQKFKTVDFSNAGYVDPASFTNYEEMFNSFAINNYNVDHDNGDDDVAPGGNAL